MTSYAIKEDGIWKELPRGRPISIGDVLTSYDSMLAWSSQYRTARNIKVVEDETIPDGKIGVGEPWLEDRDGKPVRVWALEDAPEPVQEEPEYNFPTLYAAAQLTIADGEISGIEINSRFAGAFILDVGKYFVMFLEPFEDTKYMAMPTAIGPCNAYVFPSDKEEGGFMVTVTDSEGQPCDVSALNISIVRN